jgi:hypothetical protein
MRTTDRYTVTLSDPPDNRCHVLLGTLVSKTFFANLHLSLALDTC